MQASGFIQFLSSLFRLSQGVYYFENKVELWKENFDGKSQGGGGGGGESGNLEKPQKSRKIQVKSISILKVKRTIKLNSCNKCKFVCRDQSAKYDKGTVLVIILQYQLLYSSMPYIILRWQFNVVCSASTIRFGSKFLTVQVPPGVV